MPLLALLLAAALDRFAGARWFRWAFGLTAAWLDVADPGAEFQPVGFDAADGGRLRRREAIRAAALGSRARMMRLRELDPGCLGVGRDPLDHAVGDQRVRCSFRVSSVAPVVR